VPNTFQGPADVPQLELPGSDFYPESLSVAEDGTLYVGSLATGQIVRFMPGSTVAEVFLPAGTAPLATGVLVDDKGGALYVCTNDPTFSAPPVVHRYRLDDGTPSGVYPLAAAGLANDLALDGKGNLYVTDAFGRIYQLRQGGAELRLWSSDPWLAPQSADAFGVDGISWDGHGGLYVNNNHTGGIAWVPINDDGSAGSVLAIPVTPPLAAPDGMRALDKSTLVVVEAGHFEDGRPAGGRLTRVSITGRRAKSAVLQDDLNEPSSVVKYRDNYWVTEGQISRCFGQATGVPETPFLVRRFAVQLQEKKRRPVSATAVARPSLRRLLIEGGLGGGGPAE